MKDFISVTQTKFGIIKRDIEVTIPNNIKNGGYIREYKKNRKVWYYSK